MGAPDIEVPDVPDPPEVPKNTSTGAARKIRRPQGLDAAQLKAAAEGTSRFRVPILGLNIPEF